MALLSVLALITMMIGNLWFAWEVYQREELVWAVLLFLVPFPLVGLYLWYRSDWAGCYRVPASTYFAGYALVFILGKVAH